MVCTLINNVCFPALFLDSMYNALRSSAHVAPLRFYRANERIFNSEHGNNWLSALPRTRLIASCALFCSVVVLTSSDPFI